MGLSTLYQLTPVDITDLRTWRKSHGVSGYGMADGGLDAKRLDVPYIVCAPSDGTFYLHSQGRCVAGSMRPEVMCALLVAERLEPGWVAQVADAKLTPEEALRSPTARAEARQRLAAGAARDKLATAEVEAERKRRASHLRPADHSTLDLSDLISTL